jgi:hypothetical protein
MSLLISPGISLSPGPHFFSHHLPHQTRALGCILTFRKTHISTFVTVQLIGIKGMPMTESDVFISLVLGFDSYCWNVKDVLLQKESTRENIIS